MSHADVAASIAAAVEQDLGLKLPLPAHVICAAYGWHERLSGDSRRTRGDIVTERDTDPGAVARKMIITAAERLCIEAGYDHPPLELVLALAERLGGANLLAPTRQSLSLTRFAMGGAR